jgi:hypothetical protein
MRAAIGVVLFATGFALPADAAPRYGIHPDPKSYPQATPQETLASVLKAVDAGRFDYLLAQLAEPSWVDDRVNRLHGGRFSEQVEDTRARFDAPTIKLLRRFLSEGKWNVSRDDASATLEGVERGLHFIHKSDRWYLQNRDR